MPASILLPAQSPLGKAANYKDTYDPTLLFPIARQRQRDEIGVLPEQLPFQGVDVWNAFELSWLNPKGKPMVALAEFCFPCSSPNLIESKSFKLYLNSFNQSQFAAAEQVAQVLGRDLSTQAGAEVTVKLMPLDDSLALKLGKFTGLCIDHCDIDCDRYDLQPAYLVTTDQRVENESIYSNLLKSNCLVTGQPDWGSVQITYTGKQINHEGLLRYLVSFRKHMEFHEQCVERIFMDIQKRCKPEKLTVEARYTRRGGLDINPYRSTESGFPSTNRLCRQ